METEMQMEMEMGSVESRQEVKMSAQPPQARRCRRCLGVNRIIWAVNECGSGGHDHYVTVMLMKLMSRKTGQQFAEIGDDKCPQILPQSE
uniref:GG24708 n=1 Tax=Drosophila erecta TaxID=7220 RepID=B3NYV4_DROER